MKKDVTNDRTVVHEILDKTESIWLAINDAQGPYCLAVNFAREGDILYIHSGIKGRKAAALRTGATIAFGAACDTRLKTGDNACDYGFRFRSVSGTAVPRELEGEEQREALDIITRQYAKKLLPYDERVLKVTTTFALEIDSATARIKD